MSRHVPPFDPRVPDITRVARAAALAAQELQAPSYALARVTVA